MSVPDGFKEGSVDGMLVGTSDGNGLVDGTFVIPELPKDDSMIMILPKIKCRQ